MSNRVEVVLIVFAGWQAQPSGVATFIRHILRLNGRDGIALDAVEIPRFPCGRQSPRAGRVGAGSAGLASRRLFALRLILGTLRELAAEYVFLLKRRERMKGRLLVVNEFGCETLPIAARLAFPFRRVIAISHTRPGVTAAAMHPARRATEQLCARAVSAVVFNSHALRRMWTERLNGLDAAASTIRLGSDAPSPSASADSLKRPTPDAVEFVCVARFVEGKGHRNLLEAWKLLLTRTNRRVRLTLVGDGPVLQDIRNAVAAQGLADTVSLPGSRPNGAECFDGADVGVLLSIEPEAFGLVLLEAMSRGKPVVASRLGGIPEIVADGETGMLVDPFNADEVAEALCRLAELEETRRQMGELGYKRWKETFTAQRMLDDYAAFFREWGR